MRLKNLLLSAIAIALLALLNTAADAAIAINQSIAMTTFTNVSSKAVTFGSAMSNPSLILVMVTVEKGTSAPAISSVVDNKNAGSYSQDVTITNTSGVASGEGTAAIYSIQNTQTAAASITVTLASAGYGTVTAYELTGASTTSAFDRSATQFINTGGGAVSLALSGLTADDAVFSVITLYPTPTATTDSGFTATGGVVSGFQNKHYGEYDLDYAAGGSLTLTYGGLGGNPNAFATVAAAYKVAGGGPAGPPPSQFFLSATPRRAPMMHHRSTQWADRRRRLAA